MRLFLKIVLYIRLLSFILSEFDRIQGIIAYACKINKNWYNDSFLNLETFSKIQYTFSLFTVLITSLKL